jgi:glycosyltransferase involved in cell wall biosynthesis
MSSAGVVLMLETKSLTQNMPRPGQRRLMPVDQGVVHLCNGLDPIRDGGMVPSILGMAGALAEIGEMPTSIVTTTPSRLDLLQIPDFLPVFGPETDFREAVKKAGAVHIHGLWQMQSRIGSRVARQNAVPYVVAAHGMAEPWALQQKALKKKIYMALVERRVLRNAACLHALTRPEVGFLKAIAPQTPIAWIPNGVNLKPLEHLPDRTEVEAVYPQIKGKFTLLFLSRLHVKKGLDMLAEALSEAWGKADDWHLLLAGTEDGAGQAFVKQMNELGLGDHLTAVGHVSGEKARLMWAGADAFILPSRSEGFSMSVLESLAARVPAIITTACHFPELAEAAAGIVCEPDVKSIGEALHLMKNEFSAEDRRQIAECGRELVEDRYTWESQARRLLQVYRWIEKGSAKPDFVE